MPEELIKKIAEEIITNALFKNSFFYLALIAVSIVSGAISAFCVAYLKKRGENLATKEDFDNLLQQLKINTTATESIKVKISSDFAEASARKALIREKLENFIETTFFVEHWLEKSRNEQLKNEEKILEFSNSQMSRLLVYKMTYFPEIEHELNQFNDSANAVWKWNSNVLYLLRRSKTDPTIDLDKIDIQKFEKEELLVFRTAALNLQNAVLAKYSEQAGL
ncbi:hypothetical protein H8K52_06850 [Undibacterium seohonense]|uniref:Uncharacterized protein n=1 Tax=Undibacterium seohonense TaxID=1344950 RepID=A0ABR6X2I2_9BURK|nr:hypothetical protein [Undibacterium seohonense]MBC3807060.1 hypothetical protein [Undibacterium seohonense]